MSAEDRGYNYAQTAEKMGKSVRTIRRWVAEGRLPVVRFTKQTRYIARAVVDRIASALAAEWTDDDERFLLATARP